MKVMIIGQCTLHWGRMEFGNIGNYYIIEPLIREIHRVFPGCIIKTSFQMSKEFCERERITTVPMDFYYGWRKGDLDTALKELASAEIYSKTGNLPLISPYIEELLDVDLVIDFSGDIWGDNADFLGDNRFLIGLCKDRVAQLLGKTTAMIAGSPGPFEKQSTKELAKEVYKSFTLVTNREPLSTIVLKQDGFDCSNTHDLACPAFLFNPIQIEDLQKILKAEDIPFDNSPIVGFILSGWNFPNGPFDKDAREDSEFTQFAEGIEYIVSNFGAKVVLMSHSNGFPVPPKTFELIHGRDYKIIKQLQKVVEKRGMVRKVFSLDKVYDAWTTKAIIGKFDMLISGRVHGAVAGLSQNVPTVLVDYGNGPQAHKIRGFAKVAGAEEYVASPNVKGDLLEKIKNCWQEREQYRSHLESHIPSVKELARKNFELLKTLTS